MVLKVILNHISYLRAFSIFIVLLVRASSSHASLLNHTIDDTLGDALTGNKPVYDSSWVSSADCDLQFSATGMDNHPECGLLFDGSVASNKTWHSVLDAGSLSLLFNGSSIYTYFIVPSLLLTSAGSAPTHVGSNLSFILDGDVVHDFILANRFGKVKHNVLAYSNISLSEGTHNLTIRSSETMLDRTMSLRPAAVFDYAIYTVDDGMEGDSREIRIDVVVLGIAIAAIVLCLMLLGGFFLRLRARRRHPALNIDSWKDLLPSLTITMAGNAETGIGRPPLYHKEHIPDFSGEDLSGELNAYKLDGAPHDQTRWPGAVQSPRIRFPTVQLRRGSASRLEAGVNLNVRNSLMVGVDDVLRRNAVENRDSGLVRRRSTLSRLGIPLDRNNDASAIQNLSPIAEPGHSPSVTTRRRCTVGNSHDSLRVEVGSHCDDDSGMQDDRSLVMRLQAEIRILRAERKIRLDLARLGLGLGGDCVHGEEPPDYDSVV